MTLGMGNRDPRRDTVSPAMDPTATMYFANMQPCMENISISGASASISLYGTISVSITETWRKGTNMVLLLHENATAFSFRQRWGHLTILYTKIHKIFVYSSNSYWNMKQKLFMREKILQGPSIQSKDILLDSGCCWMRTTDLQFGFTVISCSALPIACKLLISHYSLSFCVCVCMFLSLRLMCEITQGHLSQLLCCKRAGFA